LVQVSRGLVWDAFSWPPRIFFWLIILFFPDLPPLSVPLFSDVSLGETPTFLDPFFTFCRIVIALWLGISKGTRMIPPSLPPSLESPLFLFAPKSLPRGFWGLIHDLFSKIPYNDGTPPTPSGPRHCLCSPFRFSTLRFFQLLG